jgi:hypothetical protein
MTDRVQQAIDAFNAQGLTEETPCGTERIRARRPILATDCDYEIVRFSGVQGVRCK